MEDDDRAAMYYEEEIWNRDMDEQKQTLVKIKKTSLKSKLLGCISHALIFINDSTNPNKLYNELESRVNKIIDETEIFIW